jgi:PIN domain nuclease of toxin-antitoxin system
MLQSEPGGQAVSARRRDAVIGAVNAIEIGTRLVDGGIDADQARISIARLRIPIVDFDAELASMAVELRERTRPLGLSLADRACLALALREGAIALTADRAWAKLDIGCEIELIR